VERYGATRIAPGSVDVAILKNVLYQSLDKPSMFKEAARLLKTGGRLL
jgi:ubiquinone/menaquinone biosynthesis C-methylase UbiE